MEGSKFHTLNLLAELSGRAYTLSYAARYPFIHVFFVNLAFLSSLGFLMLPPILSISYFAAYINYKLESQLIELQPGQKHRREEQNKLWKGKEAESLGDSL